MEDLNNFRLSYETAFLFVLSYEYSLPFPKLLSMYNLSDKLFWAYLSLFTNMSKMGIRKGSQLSKMANRIYKNIRGIKDKSYVKVEVDVIDEDGNLVYDDKGRILKEKQTKIETKPVVLTSEEEKIKKLMKYYINHGYSDGFVFYSDVDLIDKNIRAEINKDFIKIDGVPYLRCSEISFMLEKYFPKMTLSEYRNLSVCELNDMLSKVCTVEEVLSET